MLQPAGRPPADAGGVLLSPQSLWDWFMGYAVKDSRATGAGYEDTLKSEKARAAARGGRLRARARRPRHRSRFAPAAPPDALPPAVRQQQAQRAQQPGAAAGVVDLAAVQRLTTPRAQADPLKAK